MLNQQQLEALYQKFLAGQCTRQELKDLLAHFEEAGTDSPLMAQVRKELESDEAKALPEKVERIVKATDERMAQLLQNKPVIKRYRIFKYSIAASIILAISLGGYFLSKMGQDQAGRQQMVSKYGDDVAPGSNKAMLTLSDGSSYQLADDSTAIKSDSTGIYYKDGKAIVSNLLAPVTATITTPNGGQYRLVLPDGTQVILNAASSLSYPTRFSGNTRTVNLDGEAYFEVTKNPVQPFVVTSNGQNLRVLGTKFNQYAYPKEAVKTTLVEGSVQVALNNAAKEVILKPGQQATASGNGFKVEQVDVDEATAWAHNSFVFSNATLAQIMMQLERWYDIEAIYPAKLGAKRLYAEISRDKKLSQVLAVLERSAGVTFKIEGRKVTIAP